MKKLKAHIAQLQSDRMALEIETAFCMKNGFKVEEAHKRHLFDFITKEIDSLKECLNK